MRSGRYLSVLVAIHLAALMAGPARPATAAAPASPQGLSGFPGNGSVLLIFQAVQDAEGYFLYRRQATETPENALVLSAEPTSNAWFIDNNQEAGLPNGTPLFYSVTAVVGGIESPASPEVVVTPQTPLSPSFVYYYDIGTLTPGHASLDGKTLTLTGSGSGIGDQGVGQTFLAMPIVGNFTLTAQLLQAPSVISGADPTSTDEGIVGLQFREDLSSGARYALVGAYVHHDPEIVFAGQKSLPKDPPRPFSSGQTPFADAHFPLYLRLQKMDTIIRAFQSQDGSQWEKVGDDQDFGPMPPVTYVGFVAAAHKEGAYVAGQFDFSTVSIKAP